MSADNWAICPKCKQSQDKQREKLEKSIEDSYGKLPKQEYLDLVERVKTPSGELDRTLREDWQIFMAEDGVFYVAYSCSCSKCMFHYEFKQEKKALS